MALNGNHDAEFELGIMFDDGDGVEQDYAKAIEWYTKAAQGGNRQAAFNLGMMYKNGDGVPADMTVARRWFTRASDAGDTRATVELANMSYMGRSVPQDYGKALQYFLKAAKGGNALAQMNAGVMYVRAEGMAAQDIVEGYAWLWLGAEGGNERAASLLRSLGEKLTEEQRKKAEARAQELKKEIKR
jgi:TPR repeat protein